MKDKGERGKVAKESLQIVMKIQSLWEHTRRNNLLFSPTALASVRSCPTSLVQRPTSVQQARNSGPRLSVAVSNILGFLLHSRPIWPSRGIPRPCAAASPRDIQVIGELISSQGARHQVPKPTDLFPPDPETWPSASRMTSPRALPMNMDWRWCTAFIPLWLWRNEMICTLKTC